MVQQAMHGVPDWLRSFSGPVGASVPAGEVRRLFEHLDREIRSGSLQAVDSILAVLADQEISHELMVATLRYTAPVKERLLAWPEACARVVALLDGLGLDSFAIMLGLLPARPRSS